MTSKQETNIPEAGASELFTTELLRLKALAYDKIAMLEQIQRELSMLNKAIASKQHFTVPMDPAIESELGS